MQNLLFITTDQERWHYNDPVPLPGHERLRRTGTAYDRFYVASVACSAARSVIYTGRHVTDTKVVANVGNPGQGSLRTDLPTLGNVLRDRGYVTAYKGKWHLAYEAYERSASGPLSDALEPYGFSDYNEVGDDLGFPYEGYRSDRRIASDAVDWMKTRGRAAAAAGRPWCLAVNFVNPHDIMFGTADPEILDQNRKGGPAPGRFEPFVGPPDDEIYRARWDDVTDDPTWGHDPATADRPGAHREFALSMTRLLGRGATSSEELHQFRSYYFNCMRDVDNSLMTVLTGLDESGLADQTVVVYTSDHGELAGSHGMFGKGPCLYDANVRIPLFVVEPGVAGGSRRDSLGSQLDLIPTLVSLATGEAAPSTFPGVDLSPVNGTGGRDEALFVFGDPMFLDGEWNLRTQSGRLTGDFVTGRDFAKRGFMRSIITDRHKLTRYFAPGDHDKHTAFEELKAHNTVELFDLENDPLEMTNLAIAEGSRHDDLIEELANRLQARFETEIGDDDGSWMPRIEGAPWLN